jgi:hypothetical protein
MKIQGALTPRLEILRETLLLSVCISNEEGKKERGIFLEHIFMKT